MPVVPQVEKLLDVYREQGPEKLETYAVPLLSWQDYQDIREESAAAAALPAGTSGRLLQGGSGDSRPRAVALGPGGSQTGSGGSGNKPGAAAAATDASRQAAPPTPPAVPEAAVGQDEGQDMASEAGSLDIDDLCGLD